MDDKEYRRGLAIVHGKLYAIMQALAVLIAEANDGSYDGALQRMNDDAETYSTMLLNDIEAQGLADGD